MHRSNQALADNLAFAYLPPFLPNTVTSGSKKQDGEGQNAKSGLQKVVKPIGDVTMATSFIYIYFYGMYHTHTNP